MKAECGLAKLPYGLARKEVSGRAYLYEIRDRKGNAKSLGPWSEAFAEKLDAYRHKKETLKARIAASKTTLEESASIARVLRVPMIANEAGPILREADRRGLLDGALLAVGTNAVAAYALEIGRASWRESVCPAVEYAVVAGYSKKTKTNN